MPVVFQPAGALAFELRVSSMRLALTGRRSTTFKSVPDRFVAYPSHVLSVRSGGCAASPPSRDLKFLGYTSIRIGPTLRGIETR